MHAAGEAVAATAGPTPERASTTPGTLGVVHWLHPLSGLITDTPAEDDEHAVPVLAPGDADASPPRPLPGVRPRRRHPLPRLPGRHLDLGAARPALRQRQRRDPREEDPGLHRQRAGRLAPGRVHRVAGLRAQPARPDHRGPGGRRGHPRPARPADRGPPGRSSRHRPVRRRPARPEGPRRLHALLEAAGWTRRQDQDPGGAAPTVRRPPGTRAQRPHRPVAGADRRRPGRGRRRQRPPPAAGSVRRHRRTAAATLTGRRPAPAAPLGVGRPGPDAHPGRRRPRLVRHLPVRGRQPVEHLGRAQPGHRHAGLPQRSARAVLPGQRRTRSGPRPVRRRHRRPRLVRAVDQPLPRRADPARPGAADRAVRDPHRPRRPDPPGHSERGHRLAHPGPSRRRAGRGTATGCW